MTSHPRPVGPALRPAWHSLPDRLQTVITERLGSPVHAAIGQTGGFTPGLAARLRLANGRRFFLKAIPQDHPLAGAYRHEADVAAQLPPLVPAPMLRWHGTCAGWIALVFDDIAGRHPDLSPHAADLPTVLATITTVATVPPPSGLPSVTDTRSTWLHGWDALAADPPTDLPDWAAARLPDLAAAEKTWTAHAEGTTLVHGDLRPDNLLLTDRAAMAVDWAHATVGAAWLDLADLIPQMIMAGHDPESAETRLAHLPAWRDTPPEAITGYTAAYAGYWTRMSHQPDPAGVPHLRTYQRRAAQAALTWITHRWR